jgi:hypothetical protein
MPDTYVPPEPFTAYRAWNWTSEGVTSLNGELWTPKQAFEAKCHYANDLRSIKAAAPKTAEAKQFWGKHVHHVPDPTCTCGMYAAINMQHMIDIGYIQRGIHGEVSLWGRLHRYTLGWRAQYAYPKLFVVPANMIPTKAEEAQERLAKLVEFGVDIYLQREREAHVGQQRIPLWVKDYGYSQQGISLLIERWKNWNSHKIVHTLAVGDRLAVLGDGNGGGIGVVTEINGEEMYYSLFNPNEVYRKKLADVRWNGRNWRWEAIGLGAMRKLEEAAGK